MIPFNAERLASTYRKFLAAAFVLTALTLFSLSVARPAHAETTFTVNTVGDQPDVRLSDGVCDTDGDAFNGLQCTLRAAIQQANVNLGHDTIEFNIASDDGVVNIFPLSDLPRITEQVTINGYSQPGATVNTETRPGRTNARPLIQLNGAFVEEEEFSEDGLDIGASDVVVRGLIIDRFTDDGIDVTGRVSGIKLQGNFIGVDPSGTRDFGNEAMGVNVFNTEGDHLIGGTKPAARNLISGNDTFGVNLTSEARGSRIVGNIIGTDATGTKDLGNNLSGVFVGSSGVTVGGFPPKAANTIAFNESDGVNVESVNAGSDVTSNRVLSNSIFSNGGIGIDLEGGTENAAGATKNDEKDPDAGPNDLQNRPVVTSATNSGGKTTLRGQLNSTSGDAFLIQFFSNPSGKNEGKKLIGSKSVSTNTDGNVAFNFIPARKLGAGKTVTATATNVAEANTSEFSAARTVLAE